MTPIQGNARARRCLAAVHIQAVGASPGVRHLDAVVGGACSARTDTRALSWRELSARRGVVSIGWAFRLNQLAYEAWRAVFAAPVSPEAVKACLLPQEQVASAGRTPLAKLGVSTHRLPSCSWADAFTITPVAAQSVCV
jgi:hypothetical protein